MIFTDEELLHSALKYATKKQWRFGDPTRSLVAYRRGKEFYARCCSHMVSAINLQNLPYSVYAFEFEDGWAYVGYTHEPLVRYKTHLHNRYVGAHYKKCRNHEFKILRHSVKLVETAALLEFKWHEIYEKAGWRMINRAKCGSLIGAVARKFTEEVILQTTTGYTSATKWRKENRGAAAAAKKYYPELFKKIMLSLNCRFVIQSWSEIISSAKKHLTKKLGIKLNLSYSATQSK